MVNNAGSKIILSSLFILLCILKSNVNRGQIKFCSHIVTINTGASHEANMTVERMKIIVVTKYDYMDILQQRKTPKTLQWLRGAQIVEDAIRALYYISDYVTVYWMMERPLLSYSDTNYTQTHESNLTVQLQITELGGVPTYIS